LGTLDQHVLSLEPQPRERVWGGQRLLPASPPVGEVWLAYGPSRVARGAFEGRTLDDLAVEFGPALLGTMVASRFGSRIPLLIKLLDCADWLSVQVHPDDEQAARMVGPGEPGKTEAWYFVDAEPRARIMIGVKPGIDLAQLADAIRDGRIRDVVAVAHVGSGDAILVPAGTLHALGPGLLLYEIQQASDTTYRVYDWDRPASEGRRLHIEEAVAVTRAVGGAEMRHPRVGPETGASDAIECPYFDLDLVRVAVGAPLAANTAGLTFNVLTVIDGSADVIRGQERATLRCFDTALVAGSAGEYEIRALDGPATLLRAAVPA
jgi:mannose-6-phosphate isomerase